MRTKKKMLVCRILATLPVIMFLMEFVGVDFLPNNDIVLWTVFCMELIVVIVGIIAAIWIDPRRFGRNMLKPMKFGWRLGLAIPLFPVDVFFGAILAAYGFALALLACFFLPVVLTV